MVACLVSIFILFVFVFCIFDLLKSAHVKFLCFLHRTVSFRSRVLPPNSVWMEDAKLKGLQICHPQVFWKIWIKYRNGYRIMNCLLRLINTLFCLGSAVLALCLDLSFFCHFSVNGIENQYLLGLPVQNRGFLITFFPMTAYFV